MLFGRVSGSKAELGGNLGACRGHAGFSGVALDEAQDPGLARCQIGHTVIIYSTLEPRQSQNTRLRESARHPEKLGPHPQAAGASHAIEMGARATVGTCRQSDSKSPIAFADQIWSSWHPQLRPQWKRAVRFGFEGC